MADNYDSTHPDDGFINSGSEDAMLADILRSSPIAQEAGVAPPPIVNEESHREEALEGSEELEYEEDLEDIPADSADEDDVELDDEEGSESEEGDEDATAPQDAPYLMDDLEDIMVTHKIDGEEVTRPLSEWISGSATKQHLSNQGRELGEARKQLDEERTTKLAEIERLGAHLAHAAQYEETQLSNEYHEISHQLQKAIAEGDTYDIGELTTKQAQAQKSYWEVRSKREGTENAIQAQIQQQRNNSFQQQVDSFYSEIGTVIPDWDETIQSDVREFAINEGLPSELIDQITNPSIVKFVDDYRRLKTGVAKGAKKRAAAPKTTKKIPAKKNASSKQKQASKKNMVTARAMRENASPEDQMAFLRQHAEKTLGRRG